MIKQNSGRVMVLSVVNIKKIQHLVYVYQVHFGIQSTIKIISRTIRYSLVLYQEHLLEEMQLPYSTAPTKWANQSKEE